MEELRPADPDLWLPGIPVYLDYDDEWTWTDSGPIDVNELFDYRERLLSDPNLDFAVYEIVCLMIESAMITKAAIERITFYSS
jgi:hypothetical protein